MNNFYKVQEFAKKAGVTERTLRYYDKIQLLESSYKNEALHRFYTDDDFKKLQKITTLKFLGFSIAEIKEYNLDDTEQTTEVMLRQKRIVELKIKQLNIIKESLEVVDKNIKKSHNVDWDLLIEEIKNLRVNKHKDRDGVLAERGENYKRNHKIMMELLVEFSKARKEESKIEIIKGIEKSVNNMEAMKNGLDNLLNVLEEVDIIPEELRGINIKDIENLIEFIKKYKNK